MIPENSKAILRTRQQFTAKVNGVFETENQRHRTVWSTEKLQRVVESEPYYEVELSDIMCGDVKVMDKVTIKYLKSNLPLDADNVPKTATLKGKIMPYITRGDGEVSIKLTEIKFLKNE